MKKSGKILAGVAVAAVVACGGIGMAGCGDTKAYVATAEQLFEAVEVVEEGMVIALKNDIALDNTLDIERKVTIDLNGKTLSVADEIQETMEYTLICVKAGGELTIQGEGTIDAATQLNDYSMAIWAKNGGKVTINGGKFTNAGAKDVEDDEVTPNNNELIYANNGGVITINGGEFIGNWENDKWGTRYTLNMKDENPNTDAIEGGEIKVTGGKFYQYNPAASLSENPQANFVADGYESELVGEYYVVSRVEA